MTIIHLSSSLGGGGAEQMVLQLSKKSNLNLRTIVISISNDNELESQFKENGIEYYFLNITSFKNKTIIDGIIKLHNILCNVTDGVFHCHQFHGFLLGFIYNLKYKSIPIIFTLHSSVVEAFNRKVFLFLTKPFRKIDVIFSKNARLWYLKNTAIIPNGIEIKSFAYDGNRSYNPNDTFSFLYLGRLSREKNPLYMITAANHLLRQGIDNFVFTVVGKGNLYNELIQQIEEHHLKKHFNLLGFQNNIQQILIESHCLILPSLWEGMPMVIIEAAAAKLPIVTTPVGSIPDILDLSNSYLSTLDNFYKSMIEVIQNYNNALLKTEKLFQEIQESYTISKVYDKHLYLYNSLI